MTAAVADVLDRAADLLERDGWGQGLAIDGLGCRSLQWALNVAAGESRIWIAAMNAAGRQIGTELSAWNDAPGRTAAEVIAALRAAAAKERAAA